VPTATESNTVTFVHNPSGEVEWYLFVLVENSLLIYDINAENEDPLSFSKLETFEGKSANQWIKHKVIGDYLIVAYETSSGQYEDTLYIYNLSNDAKEVHKWEIGSSMKVIDFDIYNDLLAIADYDYGIKVFKFDIEDITKDLSLISSI